MCGVVAIFSYGANGKPVEKDNLLKIRDRMTARGPDGAGYWIDDDRRVGLAHRRLSIIDLTDFGTQPMVVPETETRITFNGEIYNYRELRQDLERRGCRFRSNSDTEVLLHAYDQFGVAFTDRLRGMYALAIWDPRRKGMLLARDPFGIKPLYYADNGQTIAVASQVKALCQADGFQSALNPAGQVSFLLWGYIIEPHTFYRDIRALPAGSTMWIDARGTQAPRPFWSISRTYQEARIRRSDSDPSELSEGVVKEVLAAALAETVDFHMVADVPVGVFLSGGIDSAMLVSLAQRSGGANMRSLTLGFDEFRGGAEDEVPYAERFAADMQTQHTTAWINKNNFSAERSRLLEAMDQPSVDGANVYFVSKMAAEANIKVALSGLGGDELFGSYPSFRQIPLLVNALAGLSAVPSIGTTFRALSAPFLKHLTSPKYASLFEYGTTVQGAYLLRRGLFMPWELPEILDPDVVKSGWQELAPLIHLKDLIRDINDHHAEVAILEMSIYMRNQLLRDSDWAGMAHSLEIRVPFVDHKLLESLAPYLIGPDPLNKKGLARAVPQGLPAYIEQRPKTGFTVPVRQWLLKDQETVPKAPERGLRSWAKYVLAHH